MNAIIMAAQTRTDRCAPEETKTPVGRSDTARATGQPATVQLLPVVDSRMAETLCRYLAAHSNLGEPLAIHRAVYRAKREDERK